MPRTFDPESFDIHSFERQKPDVYPVTKKEKIDPRVLKGAKPAVEPKTHRKRIIVGAVANIFLPGLGNVFLKKTAVGTLLLALNLVLLVATLSPTSILGFLGNLAYPAYPPAIASTLTIAPSIQGFSIVVKPEMAWVFFLATGLAIATWAHFVFLAVKRRGN
jgi:hypothetical protein